MAWRNVAPPVLVVLCALNIALGTFLVVHEAVEGRWPSVIAWFVAAVLAGVGFVIYARRHARG